MPKNDYLLSGLIKCGLCGRTYIGTGYAGSKKEKVLYYVCNDKNRYHPDKNQKFVSRRIYVPTGLKVLYGTIAYLI